MCGEKKTFQTEFIGFSHPETGAHMAEILIDEAIKVVIPYLKWETQLAFRITTRMVTGCWILPSM